MIVFEPEVDLWPMLAALFAAVACGLLGNFLLLRRQSLMGDAISHSVLPGLVVAFIVTASRDPIAMFVGAAVAGIATVVLIELVKRLGRVEAGAAMGVVFSVLFALGVLLLELGAASSVDLDADCVLHGQLELLGLASGVPRQVITLAVMALLAALFVTALFKELRIAAFDPGLATSLGFGAGRLHYALMVFVAAATVASFEAVGSILVIAMLICPAASARFMTDRLATQLWLSLLVAVATAVLGYLAATSVPSIFGEASVNAAGSIVVVSGLFVALSALFAPRHGVLPRSLRRRDLAVEAALDDLLARIYRGGECGETSVSLADLRSGMAGRAFDAGVRRARNLGAIERDGRSVSLTPLGRERAIDVVRRHRLWERYLVDEAGIAPDHVHETAEQLEHLGIGPAAGAADDPHGRPIP